jgi:hypothetical protein
VGRVRKRNAWVAAGAAVLLAVGGSASWLTTPAALTPPDGTSTTTLNTCRLGELLHFGFVGFGPRGDAPIRFTGASLVGVDPGLTVDGIDAVKVDETPSGRILMAASESDWATLGQGITLRPVTDVALDPHSDKSQWWLVARVRSRVAGQAETNGIRITYTVGIRSGSVTFPYRTVSNCAASTAN